MKIQTTRGVQSHNLPLFSNEQCRKASPDQKWVVGDDTYDTTAELLNELPDLSRPVPATYKIKPGFLSRLGLVAQASAVGAGILGGIGAFVGFAGTALFETAGMIAPFFGVPLNGTLGSMVGPALCTAALGAVGGGLMAMGFNRMEYGGLQNIEGSIGVQKTPDADRAVFQPDASDTAVDLQVFAKSPPEYAYVDEGQWWQELGRKS
jgi:hypothetical protein